MKGDARSGSLSPTTTYTECEDGLLNVLMSPLYAVLMLGGRDESSNRL